MPDKNLRLLILDDRPEDRTVIRFMLEQAPGLTWQFLEEETSAAALQRLEHARIRRDLRLARHLHPGGQPAG